MFCRTIRTRFESWRNRAGDLEGWKYLHVAHVRALQEAVLRAHGGSAGIRDDGLLESAVLAPQATMMGRPLFTDPVEIAAAYLFYLCRNHPFLDGNKRTALMAGLVFLRLNGLHPQPDGPLWEALVLDVAAGRLGREETTLRLRPLVNA